MPHTCVFVGVKFATLNQDIDQLIQLNLCESKRDIFRQHFKIQASRYTTLTNKFRYSKSLFKSAMPLYYSTLFSPQNVFIKSYTLCHSFESPPFLSTSAFSGFSSSSLRCHCSAPYTEKPNNFER